MLDPVALRGLVVMWLGSSKLETAEVASTRRVALASGHCLCAADPPSRKERLTDRVGGDVQADGPLLRHCSESVSTSGGGWARPMFSMGWVGVSLAVRWWRPQVRNGKCNAWARYWPHVP